MAFIQFRRTKVRRFSSAVIAVLPAAVASVLLFKVALLYSGTIREGLLTLAVAALAVSLFVLFRIRKAYDSNYQKAVAGDGATALALNTMVRAYSWGNGLFLILALVLVVTHK